MNKINNQTITSKQGVFLVCTFIIGTSAILSGMTTAKQDIWIAFLLAFIVSIPMLFIYSKILTLFPGKNMFQIMDISFGKLVGKIISLMYILYFLYLSALIIRNITEFIQVVSLRLTPQYFTGIWLVLVGAYMVKSGLEVFGRWANFTFVFIMLLIILIFTLSIFEFDFEAILPVLYDGWSPVIKNAVSIFSFPFGEVVVFLAFFNNLKDQKKTFNILLLSLSIAGMIILLTTIRSIFILGFPLIENTYFPVYYANTLIRFDNIMENISIFSTIILILAGLGKFAACLFAVCIGLKHIFNSKDFVVFSLPLGFLALLISQLLFTSTMEMMENVEVYHYYALPFQVIFPIIILLFGWIKSRRQGS